MNLKNISLWTSYLKEKHISSSINKSYSILLNDWEYYNSSTGQVESSETLEISEIFKFEFLILPYSQNRKLAKKKLRIIFPRFSTFPSFPFATFSFSLIIFFFFFLNFYFTFAITVLKFIFQVQFNFNINKTRNFFAKWNCEKNYKKKESSWSVPWKRCS